MIKLTALWQRIPKAVLFGAAILLQCALLVLMVADRVRILREGREVTLQTRPVDPRDLLRGDYVVLGYDISQLPAGALAGQPTAERNPVVFVKLAPDANGLYQAVSVHAAPVTVTAPEVLIRGRVSYSCGSTSRTFCDKTDDQIRPRKLFRAGRRGQDARTGPQPAKAARRRRRAALGPRRHQAAVARRRAGL